MEIPQKTYSGSIVWPIYSTSGSKSKRHKISLERTTCSCMSKGAQFTAWSVNKYLHVHQPMIRSTKCYFIYMHMTFYTYMSVCIYICTYICICIVSMHIRMYMSVYAFCVCVYTYICIHTYIKCNSIQANEKKEEKYI